MNTFTAVVKCMANPDLLRGARMLGLLTAGEEKAHARMAHEMRGVAAIAAPRHSTVQIKLSTLGNTRQVLHACVDSVSAQYGHGRSAGVRVASNRDCVGGSLAAGSNRQHAADRAGYLEESAL